MQRDDRVYFSWQDVLRLLALGSTTTGLLWFLLVPSLGHPQWVLAINPLLSAQADVTHRWRMLQYDGLDHSDEVLNRWLAQQMTVEETVQLKLYDPPGVDVWGNPYRVQRRRSPHDPPRVYSLGQDGVSSSDGADPDDLCGWVARPGAGYANREPWRQGLLLGVVFICCTIVWFFLAGGWGWLYRRLT